MPQLFLESQISVELEETLVAMFALCSSCCLSLLLLSIRQGRQKCGPQVFWGFALFHLNIPLQATIMQSKKLGSLISEDMEL